jgi:hypothetical protein
MALEPMSIFEILAAVAAGKYSGSEIVCFFTFNVVVLEG